MVSFDFGEMATLLDDMKCFALAGNSWSDINTTRLFSIAFLVFGLCFALQVIRASTRMAGVQMANRIALF